jgi:putative hydrolase of the HAD superfamily
MRLIAMETQLPCVIFDLDDTLYLERDFVRSGFHAVDRWCTSTLRLSGVRELAQEYFEAGRRGDIFDAVLEKLKAPHADDTIKDLVRVYREHAPSIVLATDAARCLSTLKGQVHLGLLTDGNSVTQWGKINALGIRDAFEEIVVTGDWGTEFFKPHLRGFQHLERRFGSPSARFIYVADNPSKDFTGPRELGWRTVRVKRPAGLYSHRLCPPDLAPCEIVDLESLPEMIRSLT